MRRSLHVTARQRGAGGHARGPMALRWLATALLATPAYAQSGGPLELTTQNFVQAAKQPIAWLINIEQPSNAQSRQAAQILQPALGLLEA